MNARLVKRMIQAVALARRSGQDGAAPVQAARAAIGSSKSTAGPIGTIRRLIIA